MANPGRDNGFPCTRERQASRHASSLITGRLQSDRAPAYRVPGSWHHTRSEYNFARVAAAFDAVSDWILEGAVRFWMKRSIDLEEKALNKFSPELARLETQLPITTTGLWRPAPDEILVIEFQDPMADFRGLQLALSLWHTLDYANRPTSINQAQ